MDRSYYLARYKKPFIGRPGTRQQYLDYEPGEKRLDAEGNDSAWQEAREHISYMRATLNGVRYDAELVEVVHVTEKTIAVPVNVAA